MKVNIVTENLDVGRIKRRIAEKIIKYNETDIEYSMTNPPRNDVDLNFYLCYNEFLFYGPSKVKNVCWVTHIHKSIPEHEKELNRSFLAFNYADAFLHMGQRTVDEFKNANLAQDKYHEVVWCGIESERFKPTITIGIVQNGAENKGLYFMLHLLGKYNFSNFKFIFQGIQWEPVTRRMKALGIRHEEYQTLDYTNYPSIYEKIDYLLVPSIFEGGPMAVLEAMYCGLPIISSDVGWVKEISNGYMFAPGDITGLINILKSIEDKDILKYENLERFTCTEFSNRLARSFKRITNNG